MLDNKNDKGKKDKPEDSGTEESTESQAEDAKNAPAEKTEKEKDADSEKAVVEKPSKDNDDKKKTSSSWFSWSQSSTTDMSSVVESLKEELRKHNCPSEREMLSSRFNRDSFLQLNEDKREDPAFDVNLGTSFYKMTKYAFFLEISIIPNIP